MGEIQREIAMRFFYIHQCGKTFAKKSDNDEYWQECEMMESCNTAASGVNARAVLKHQDKLAPAYPPTRYSLGIRTTH